MASAMDGHDWCCDDGYDEYVISESETPSTQVVLSVARSTDHQPTDLRPLNEVIDPDALDRLVRDRPPSLCLTFEFEGCTVCTDGDLIRVQRP